jgi:hypothetical protein
MLKKTIWRYILKKTENKKVKFDGEANEIDTLQPALARSLSGL